ncbi:MAG TPA: PKD domain-containing protein [Bacteroidia bacterium]|nr:PKD domain-containing protein [Bacteroidia bacterium]
MNLFTKTFLAAATIVSLDAHSQCSASYTWSQSQNNVIDFANTSQPIVPNSTIFYWDFGDQQYAYTQNASHTYSGPGTYVACLYMYDSLTFCQSSYCDTVSVYGNVLCNLSVNAFVVQNSSCSTCNDGVLEASASAGTPPYTYMWSNSATGAYDYNLPPGTYSVCVTDANGCQSCASVTLTASSSSSCQANYIYNQSTADTVDFMNNSLGTTVGTSYYYDFGDGNYSTLQNPTHAYTYPGTYNVCLYISDSANQCSSYYCASVNVWGPNSGPLCSANFVVIPDSSNSQQAWAYNYSTGSPTMQYYWTWGDNTAPDTIAYPSHVYSQTGTYTICLMVYDAINQCSDTMCQTINVFRLAPEAMSLPYYVNVLPTGIHEQEQTQWSLYPNPASDEIRIRTDYALQGKAYRIVDISGRVSDQGILDGNIIRVSSLENGIYFLQLDNGKGGFTVQRFVKQ